MTWEVEEEKEDDDNMFQPLATSIKGKKKTWPLVATRYKQIIIFW